MAATASGADENASRRYLAEALKRFGRSIELCDDYLRGYYGLKLVSCLLFVYVSQRQSGVTTCADLPRLLPNY